MPLSPCLIEGEFVKVGLGRWTETPNLDDRDFGRADSSHLVERVHPCVELGLLELGAAIACAESFEENLEPLVSRRVRCDRACILVGADGRGGEKGFLPARVTSEEFVKYQPLAMVRSQRQQPLILSLGGHRSRPQERNDGLTRPHVHFPLRRIFCLVWTAQIADESQSPVAQSLPHGSPTPAALQPY